MLEASLTLRSAFEASQVEYDIAQREREHQEAREEEDRQIAAAVASWAVLAEGVANDEDSGSHELHSVDAEGNILRYSGWATVSLENDKTTGTFLQAQIQKTLLEEDQSVIKTVAIYVRMGDHDREGLFSEPEQVLEIVCSQPGNILVADDNQASDLRSISPGSDDSERDWLAMQASLGQLQAVEFPQSVTA